jgi:hypothetical protein
MKPRPAAAEKIASLSWMRKRCEASPGKASRSCWITQLVSPTWPAARDPTALCAQCRSGISLFPNLGNTPARASKNGPDWRRWLRSKPRRGRSSLYFPDRSGISGRRRVRDRLRPPPFSPRVRRLPARSRAQPEKSPRFRGVLAPRGARPLFGLGVHADPPVRRRPCHVEIRKVVGYGSRPVVRVDVARKVTQAPLEAADELVDWLRACLE